MEIIHALAFLLFSLSGTDSQSMRNMSEIRYHFTTCGKEGSSGPNFADCVQHYSAMQSPITTDQLLVDFADIMPRADYYSGAQRFRVPRTGHYNVTVTGAAGGRGICSSTSGRGLTEWKGTVSLSDEEDLIILVGQRGVGPCDQTATRVQDLPMTFCQNPPTNLNESATCEQEWFAWLQSYSPDSVYSSRFFQFVGGGGGGGASFILPVTREGELVNNLPIVIAPGGGGSAALERYSFLDQQVPRPSPANLTDEEQFLLLINAQTALDPDIPGVEAGTRGYLNSANFVSNTLRPGAGGGWRSVGINLDGGALGSAAQFAIGGLGCFQQLAASIENAVPVPIQNANGGFGGGGGQCGGSGAGGGYTGGSVFGTNHTIPSGGGYFLGPQSAPQGSAYDNTSFTPLSIDLNTGEDGYVDIVPVNCGCAYDCTIYQDLEMFKCDCPDGFQLSTNEVDCFQESIVNVSLLLSNHQDGITFTPLVLSSSYEVFGLSAVLESVDDSVGTLWSCSIFLVGDNEIVAISRPVKESGATSDVLARVNSSTTNITGINYQPQLRASVTVTGAFLASLGGCSIRGMSLGLDISILESRSQALVQEDFDRFDYGTAQTLANQLLPVQQQPSTETTFSVSEKVIVGTSVAAGLLLVGVCLILIITGSVKIIGRRSRKFSRVTKASHQNNRGASHDREFRDITNSEVIVNSCEAPKANPTAERNLVVRSSLRSKLPPKLIIKSANLRVLDPIGQGEFGIVYKGYLVEQYTDEIVAIKTLKGFIDASAVEKLLSECARMKNFSNLHVMSLKGVCLDGGPVPFIVLPYMANGSLAAYLKKERKNLVVVKDNSTSDVTTDSEDSAQVLFIRKRLMDMCLQVAKGMEYLASEKIVHRDLAARNCMIDINMIIKVADFGLSVNMGAKEYYRLTNHLDIKLPVKWMAPESLADYMFSEMSDVWSYGVTCWEIFTGAQTPYPGVTSSTLHSFLQRGERLAIPNNLACNDDLYSMMQWCWKMKPDKRPSFSTLVNTLSKSLEKQADYLHVGAFTQGNNYGSSIDHNFTSSSEEITTVIS